MRVTNTVLSLLAAAALVAGCATKEPTGADAAVTINKSPNDSRQYQALTLGNGLEVVTVSDPSIEVSGASLSVGVGSYQNPEEIPGLAHYLEHMLFLGTEKYPEPNSFQAFVQENAGFSNAYTATDHTNYFFQIGEGAMDEALDRFSDYFKAPTFDREYSDKERNAVDSEWSSGKSQDSRIINRLRGLTANPEHPAQRMSVGNLQTLVDQPDMPLYETMLAFYQSHYSADNMKLVLFGKQSPEQLAQWARKHFGGIEDKPVSRPQVSTPGLTPEVTGQHIYYRPQKTVRQLIVEFSIPDNTDQWRVKPNRYLANLISSEEPGTAAQVLREKGWVDDFTVGVSPDYYGEDGIFNINIGVTESGLEHEDEIIATVFAYLQKIRRDGVERFYYRELKAMLQKQFAEVQVPNPLNQAVQLSTSLFEQPTAHLLDAYYTYEEFDPAAIKQVLGQLTVDNARIWHINPKVDVDKDIPFYEGQYRLEPFTQQQRNHWRALADEIELELPPINDLFSSDTANVVDATIEKPTLVQQKPGIEAWLAHSQYHQSQYGYLQVQFNTDLPQQSAENRVMSDLLNRVFAKKTTALRDKAGRAGIGIGIERPRHNHALTLFGYSEKHPLLYERIIERWVALNIDRQSFTVAMEGYTDWLDGRAKEEPYRQAFTELDRLMSTPSWRDSELRQASEAVTVEKLQQYQRRIVRNNRIRIYAFGNYTSETVEKIVATTERQLPEKWQKRERYLPVYRTPEVGRTIAFKDETSHTDNALLSAYYSPHNRLQTGAELLLLNSVLHQAFYTKLRTEEQIGYVVGSSIDRIGDYWGMVLYAQTTNTPLPDLQQRFEQFIQNYQQPLQQTDPQVFDTLRETVIAQINQPPANFSDEYPRYLNDFYRGNDQFDTRERLIAAIENTGKQQVVDLYQSLLIDKNAQQVGVSLQGTDFQSE